MHAVVFCPPFGKIGGLESVAAHLVSVFETHGHRVTVIARGPNGGATVAVAAHVRRLEIHMPQFPRRSRHLARLMRFGRALGAGLFQLRRGLRTGEPPAVVLSLAPPNYAPYPLALARLLHRPLVVGLHTDPAHLARHANGTVYRALLRRADALVACSQRVADAAVAEVPTCRPRLTVIPNGYDPAEFAAPVAPPGERPFVLAVGRLVPEKNFGLLVEAFAAVAGEFATLDLVIAGDGPERERLSALAAACGVSERVRFPGFTDRSTTVGLLRGCELVCCPSRWESFSLVALEAAAAGKAVVAADAGALPELVHDGETGLLVSGHEPARWADALRELLRDPERRTAFGRRARARVRDLTWDRIGARYLEVLERVGRSTPS